MSKEIEDLVEHGRQARDAAVLAYREWKQSEDAQEAAYSRFQQALDLEGKARTALLKVFEHPSTEEWDAMQRELYSQRGLTYMRTANSR